MMIIGAALWSGMIELLISIEKGFKWFTWKASWQMDTSSQKFISNFEILREMSKVLAADQKLNQVWTVQTRITKIEFEKSLRKVGDVICAKTSSKMRLQSLNHFFFKAASNIFSPLKRARFAGQHLAFKSNLFQKAILMIREMLSAVVARSGAFENAVWLFFV